MLECLDSKEIGPDVQKLSTQLRGLMEQIRSESSKDQRYPETSDAFNDAHEHLMHPSYDIVVCGEVKKGKSSLLNAIIGQNILPVDTNVATSQVFRISDSKEESFSLVFTDGTTSPITREQLSQYGSQVDANINGERTFGDRILSHIQVNVPTQFLPEHVNLVDTPGLGAVYKSHEWLTQNYVKRAVGVLFVFEASQPMVEQEKTFINKVLDITPHVMFVMTKIDLVKPSEWTAQLRRLEESLADIYAERRLPVPVVYPISSKALMEAAKEDEDDFKMENVRTSMFPVLKDELMSMIVRAVVLSYTSNALDESDVHILKTKTVISDLLKTAAEEGQNLDRQFRASKLAKQQELQDEWGENSRQTRLLTEKVSNICNIVGNRVDQMFRLTSPIRERYISLIDGITSMDEVEEMCGSMPSAVTNDIVQQWNAIMRDAMDEVSAILQNAVSDIDRISIDDAVSTEIDTLKMTASQKLNNIRNVVGTGVLATGVATLIFPPVGLVVGACSAVWAWMAGKDAKVQRNKANLKTKLSEQMDKIYHALKDARSSSQVSVVGEFVGNLRSYAEKTIQNAMESKKEEMKKQLENLERLASKEVSEKRAECEQFKADLIIWNNFAAKAKEYGALWDTIEKRL